MIPAAKANPLAVQPPQPGGAALPAADRLSAGVWFGLAAAAGVTGAAFLLFDPQPSPMLALCAAANVALVLFAVYRLYQWNLLLSPIAAVVIGPGWLLHYSWGNLGARIAGEWRFSANLGSLEFYPAAALLSTVGLALFNLAVFGLFPRQARYARIKYQDLRWQPWQAPAAALAASALLLYLSLRFPFVNGYFLGVESDFDRWLAASHYFFVLLGVVVGVSVMLRGRRLADRALGAIGIGLPLLLAFGLRSRTFMVAVVVMAVLCWITLRPRQARLALLCGVAGALLSFAVGTVVKAVSVQGVTAAVSDNLAVLAATDLSSLAEMNRGSAAIDWQYRLAGFEMPAALIGAQVRGAEPMYGAGALGGLLSGLPGFLRPAGEVSERLAILRHYRGRGLVFGDSVGVPLSSGIADWGILAGPLIYVVIALFCLVLWRVAQISPRLFVAYLMAGAGPGDLFWENGAFAVRAIGFAWVALLILSPLLMPRWQPDEQG